MPRSTPRREAFLTWRASAGARAAASSSSAWASCCRSTRSDLADARHHRGGKIRSEALGEVQEMIDICDFAVGLSRQLYGRTIASERPGHRLPETWHPLGVVGVISAFNFPAAVWSWNTAVALVCGDTVVWKPSELTPLIGAGLRPRCWTAPPTRSVRRADVHRLLLGDRAVGAARWSTTRASPLVSATGSTRMGREVGPARRGPLRPRLLELGGNNAAIVTPSADLDLAVRGIVFAAAGTAGQRCTTLRRLIVHASIADSSSSGSTAAYAHAPHRRPVRRRHARRPADPPAAFDAHAGSALDRAAGRGRRDPRRRRARPGRRRRRAVYVEPGARPRCRPRPSRAARRPSRRSSTC